MKPAAGHGLLQRVAQQGGEVLGHVLDDIVGGAGAQGGHGDAALLGSGDVDDRRRVLQRDDVGQDVQALAARHVVVQGDDVEIGGAFGEDLQARVPIRDAGDGEAVAAQLLLDQPRQPAVIVDVEQADDLPLGPHCALTRCPGPA